MLVAECPNLEGKKVTFQVFEKTDVLGEKDKVLTLINKDDEPKTRIEANIKEGFAVAEVKLQHCKEDADNEDWEKLLDPDKGELKTAELYIKVEATENVFLVKSNGEFLNDEPFELGAAVVLYDIYHEGKMEKQDCNNPKKVKYYYHDSNKTKHLLGKTKAHSTKRHTKKNVLSKKKNDDIILVYAKDIQSFSSGNVKFKFHSWNSASGRWYINPDCFAGLLGAMIEESIEDLGFNGFSIKNGNTAGGSSSHINGKKGDLRYLSKKPNDSPAIHLFTNHTTKIQNPKFDYSRQEKFNNALYKFGWGRTSKMYSENFYIMEEKEIVNPKNKKKEIKKVKTKKILSHCEHNMKLGVGGWRHYHHIHLKGFDHSIIKKK